jgi:FtsH-binding integral membrane protein
MDDKPTSSISSGQIDFLLKEYETLRIFRQDLISQGDRRFNFFVAIVSGAAIFLSWLSGQQIVNNIAIGIIILGILLLGLTTFARILQRNSSIILYTRGMNRIRKYFIQHYPEMDDYLILDSHDDTPYFKSVSFSEQLPIMLALMNAIIAGVTLLMIVNLVLQWNIVQTAVAGFLVFVIMFIIQIRYYNSNMRKRVSKFRVKFPREKTT